MDAARLKRKALSYARKRGQSQEECEDFAGFVLLNIVQNSAGQHYMRRLWVDYKRATYGDSRSPSGLAAALAQHVQAVDEVDQKAAHEQVVLASREPGQTWDSLARSFGFRGDERALFLLRHEWECSLKEIGHLFGVSESRAEQLLRPIVRTVREGLACS